MLSKNLKCLLITTTIAILILSCLPSAGGADIEIPDLLPVVERARQDFPLVKELVENFSNMGSRFTGYPGCQRAARFIEEWFRKYLVDVEVQIYNITVIADRGASLTVQGSGEQFTLYPLVPNAVIPVHTPRGGITGPVVYVGSGEPAELNGNPIEGAIVLMDFNSEAKWLDVAKLNAAAVIFIEPDFTIQEEAFSKYLDRIPLDFPRLYIRQDEVTKLLKLMSQRNVTATLVADSQWETCQAANVMGWVKGRQYPDEYAIIGTYYDAYSVVPTMATGASEACSISTLLALAKYYSENPPLVSVLFLALSGHNQGLLGEKEWVNKYFYGPDRMNRDPPFQAYQRNVSVLQGTSTGYWENGKGTLITLGIDIWPDTTLLYPMPEGGYHPHSSGVWPTPRSNDIRSVYNKLKQQTGKDYGLVPNGWMQMADLESSMQATGVGGVLSINSGPNNFRWKPFEVIIFHGNGQQGPPWRGTIFSTGRACRWLYGTPIDTYEKNEPELGKVEPQMELMYSWLHFYVNTETLRGPVNMPNTSDREGRTPLEQLHKNYIPTCFLPIEVKSWNLYSGWYEPFHASPGQTILVQAFSQELGTRSYRTVWIGKAANDGTFITPCYPWFEGPRYGQKYVAYVLDENSSLIYMSDVGVHSISTVAPVGGTAYNLGFYAVFEAAKISVFRCSSAIIFDLDDPAYLDLPSSAIPQLISINYFESHAPVEYLNIVKDHIKYGYNLGAVFFEPDVPIEILVTTGFGRNLPVIILNNADERYPEGRGYTLTTGQQMKFSLFNFTQGFYYVDDVRESQSQRAGLVEPYAKAHAEVIQSMREALLGLAGYNYSKAYLYSVDMWRNEIFAYLGFRNVIEGAIQTVPFFAAMLIPVAFVLERLLLSFEGKKRILTILLLCGAILALFSLLHPGFTLASNVVVVLVSFAILTLVTPAIAIVYGRILDFLKRVRRKVMGPHFAEIARSSIFVTSVSIGIVNMKKRHLRTILTLIPIIIVAMSIVMLSELTITEEVTPTPVAGRANLPYEGLLIEREHFGEGDNYLLSVSVKMLQYLEDKYGRTGAATIAPRIWVYPLMGGSSVSAGWLLEGSNATEHVPYVLRALIGLTPQEEEMTLTWSILSSKFESGRWFTDADVWSIMIHEKVAETLGITSVPAKVTLSGIPLTVIGVYSDNLYYVTDINDYQLLIPQDFSQPPPCPNMEPRHVAIIPYRLAVMMAPYMATEEKMSSWIIDVAIKPKNPDNIFKMASEIYENFRGTTLQVWISYQGKVSLAATKKGVSVAGGAIQLVPIVLAAMIILNTMIGAVVERRREIEIFSTVGLSPIHVAGLFLAESLVYALIGGMVGYVSAMFITTIALKVFSLPLALNYASSWVVIALGLAMGVTLASSLYPSWIAARLVAPSRERRWAMPTKPYKDTWSIPLPFIATSRREAIGMLSYVNEYMSQHMSPVAPDFSVKEITPIARAEADRKEVLSFDAVLMIVPYEINITQKATLQALEQTSERWNFNLTINRMQGEVRRWTLLNRAFVTSLREQFLIWRSLKDQEKEKYINNCRL